MATGVTAFLIEVLCGMYMLVMVLRFLLRFHNADRFNPLTQQLIQLSSWVTQPFNRVFPTFGSLEVGTPVAILCFSTLVTVTLGLVQNAPVPIEQVPIWATIGMLYLACDLYFVAILAVIVLSWIAPTSRHPLGDIAFQLAEPISAPFRKIIPGIGGLDLSPIFVIISINIAQGYYVAGRSLPDCRQALCSVSNAVLS